MKKTSIIQRIINNHKIKQYNKPKYKINDLYFGQLVLLKSAEFIDKDTISNHCHIIKEFAIFYYDGIEYVHITSNSQHLKELNPFLVHFGDLAVHNVTPLKPYAIKLGYSSNSKLSKHTINEVEIKQNQKIASMQQTSQNI